MSDENTPTVETVTDKPVKARKPAGRIEHSALIALYAKQHNMTTDRAGKALRSILRREFATVAKLDPANFGAKGKIKQRANDQRPWTSHSRKVAREVLKLNVKQ